jgi:hypothetical protein
MKRAEFLCTGEHLPSLKIAAGNGTSNRLRIEAGGKIYCLPLQAALTHCDFERKSDQTTDAENNVLLGK